MNNKPSYQKSIEKWKSKTLESLEKDIWEEPEFSSHLVTTCHSLRKKQIKNFEIEDFRIMIGQNIGLKFLIPFALEKLRENVLAEGDFYEGDLLKAVLSSKNEFWAEEKKLCKELHEILSQNIDLLKEKEPELLELYDKWKINKTN